MGLRHVSAGLRVCGLLCLFFCLVIAEGSAQSTGPYPVPLPGTASGRGGISATPGSLTAPGSQASLYVGWTTTPSRVRIGYEGLVPPGQCGSSFFFFPLDGVQVGGSMPLQLTDKLELKAYGSYLFAQETEADQDITWLTFPPGTRRWTSSRFDSYALGGEFFWRLAGESALVSGFRWESLTATFSDPNPSYLLTVAAMQAQATVTTYEPYIGFRFHKSARPGDFSIRLVGFPFLFATIQHFNTCNNRGDPLAHVGSTGVTRGYFLEASAEYRLGPCRGLEMVGFVTWDLYHAQCPMFLERIDAGAGNATTGATVDFSYDRNSITIGGKVEISWNLPI